MKTSKYCALLAVLCMVIAPLIVATAYAAPGMPSSGEKQHMKLVGYNDVQGRETLQVVTNGDFTFIGHHNRPDTATIHYNPLTDEFEENGTTILDTSDPRHPTVVVHIPNVTNRNSRSPAVVYDFMESGRDFLVRNSEGQGTYYFQVFDITDITQNGGTGYIYVGRIESTGFGSCSGTPCGGILTQAHKGFLSEDGWYYAVGCEPGFRSRNNHLLIWDLSDLPDVVPHPDNELGATRFVGRAWIEGQKLTEPDVGRQSWHHPIVNEPMQEVYGGYLTGGNVVATDVSSAPSGTDLRFPNIWHYDLAPNQRDKAHTPTVIRYDEVPNIASEGLPMYFCLLSDEATGGDMMPTATYTPEPMRCKAYMFDVTGAEEHGVVTPVETWQVPNGDYWDKGGRFGPHQTAETQNSKYNTFSGAELGSSRYDKLAVFAYFNAGVRVVDISDPYNLKEVAYYVPQETPTTGVMNEEQPPTVQVNDVDIDYRGFIMTTDRVGTGFWVLQYTGQ